jgi:hypothetical protein
MKAYARVREAGTAAPAVTRAAGRPAAAAILDLQRRAGNAAVATLLAPRDLTVQRTRKASASGGKRKRKATTAAKSSRWRSKKPRPAAAAPMLTATERSRQTNACGDFVLIRKWSVKKPGKPGVIVQEVTRKFNVERYVAGKGKGKGWSAIAGAALDAYVTPTGSTVHATETHYFEAWQVGPRGGVPDGDQFALAPLTDALTRTARTTRGTYEITGKARFYPGVTLADLTKQGFSTTAVKMSNGLPATLKQPTLRPATGNTVNVTATVQWDSAKGVAGAQSVLKVK